jgi:DNA replication initiation complex subunit (GINS family)
MQQEQQMNITYETLFDVVRVEKGREDLQELRQTFYRDVVVYLRQKKELLKKKEHESGIDAYDELKKMQIQYENIQRIIKEIYDRREKKILLMVLNNSRTNVGSEDGKYLLSEEKTLYLSLKQLLGQQRSSLLQHVLQGTFSSPEQKNEEQQIEEKKETPTEKSLLSVAMRSQDRSLYTTKRGEFFAENVMLSVRFLKEIEPFVGPELETYGPYPVGHITELPRQIAEILVEKGNVEVV